MIIKLACKTVQNFFCFFHLFYAHKSILLHAKCPQVALSTYLANKALAIVDWSCVQVTQSTLANCKLAKYIYLTNYLSDIFH